MRVQLERFSIEPPAGFNDWTDYSFQLESRGEVLSVTSDSNPKTVIDLPSLTAFRRQDFERGMAGAATFESEGPAQLDDLPGHMLIYTFDDRGTRYRVRMVFALDTENSYIQLSYLTRADDAEADKKFKHILGSVTRAGKPDANRPGPGFIRRWAGKLVLDVPEYLEPPQTYYFLSLNEKTSLKLFVYDTRRSSQQIPVPEEEIRKETRSGEKVTARGSRSATLGKATGTIAVYYFADEKQPGVIKDACRLAHGMVTKETRVHLVGRAPAADEKTLERDFLQMLKSIQ
jgi:hypothetical protein